MRTLKLEDGKYEIRRHDDGHMDALRHGEPWRDLTGDKLVGALFDVAASETHVLVPRDALEAALAYLGEECWQDHHGYCQEHGLQEECFVKDFRKALGR